MIHPHLVGDRGGLNLTGLQLLATMVRDGRSTREMIAATGMSRNVLLKRAREVRQRFGVQAPWEVKREQFLTAVGERLKAGGTNESIALELGCGANTISLARQQLGMDQPASIRRTDAERDAIKVRLLAGETPRAIADDLGMSPDTIAKQVAPIRHLIPPCPCGRGYNHGGRCRSDPTKNPGVGANTGRRAAADTPKKRSAPAAPKPVAGFRYSKAASAIPADVRRRARAMAIAGERRSTVCRILGLAKWPVEALFRDLGRAGLLPAQCVCGSPYGHQGSCARSPRAPQPRQPKAYRPKHPAMTDPDRERAMRRAWARGASTRELAERFGLHQRTAWQFSRYWKSIAAAPERPCACGRPARHAGGCIKNTPGAVSGIELGRIRTAITAGVLPQGIAREIGIHVRTVLHHSLELREQLHRDGISCACGQIIGHDYPCEAVREALGYRRKLAGLTPKIAAAVDAKLLDGLLIGDIADQLAVKNGAVRTRLRQLSPAHRSQRTEAIQKRRAGRMMKISVVAKLVQAAVPKGIVPSVRDEAVAELHLAVIAGRVHPDDIAAEAPKFISRAFTQWGSAFGPRSLSETIGTDGNRELGELLGDVTAALAVEQTELGSGS